MELLIGTPIVLCGKTTTTCQYRYYYLGKGVYGALYNDKNIKGFRALGIIKEWKYIVPFDMFMSNKFSVKKTSASDKLTYSLSYSYNGEADNMKNFETNNIIDIDDNRLKELTWYNEMNASINDVLEYYGIKK